MTNIKTPPKYDDSMYSVCECGELMYDCICGCDDLYYDGVYNYDQDEYDYDVYWNDEEEIK